jgi:hypothetical protein
MARLTTMTTVDDSPHRLLLSHLQTWASSKHRDVDVDLLDQLLELRAAYDELEPTYWPGGSVEDLLLRLVPAKGRMEPLPAEAVVTSLESYFRFLRNTGRMAARSASPAELVKEAKRSAGRMKAAAEDRANWSSGKVLQDFGAQQGIPMDDAPDLETLQDRLNEITNTWNALPIHERQRLMPHPGDRDDESGCDRALAAYDIDDEVTALLLGFRYELPSGELPATTETAPIVERAGLLDRVAAMSAWMAPRIEVTATDVLRPADAHRAYEELGLRDWQREHLLVIYADGWPPRAQQIGVEAFVDDVGRHAVAKRARLPGARPVVDGGCRLWGGRAGREVGVPGMVPPDRPGRLGQLGCLGSGERAGERAGLPVAGHSTRVRADALVYAWVRAGPLGGDRRLCHRLAPDAGRAAHVRGIRRRCALVGAPAAAVCMSLHAGHRCVRHQRRRSDVDSVRRRVHDGLVGAPGADF